jgi:hypothetical protein
MNMMRRGVLAAMVVGSMAGGAVGATVLGAASSSAATTTTTTAPSSTAPQGAPPNSGQMPSGTFHPNESAAHEKGESAQREAQENLALKPKPARTGRTSGGPSRTPQRCGASPPPSQARSLVCGPVFTRRSPA